MELWFATGNPGKVKEISRILEPYNVEVKSIKDLSTYAEPDENGETFEDNARIKAKALRALKSDQWVLSEDAGLVVDGLNGYPGVHSARYAGPNARDVENVSKVLKMLGLRSYNNRKAHFKSVLCLISPEGEETLFQGEMVGEIALDMKGSKGFGYDPIFVPEGETRTLAEMEVSEKNKISHRSKATKDLVAFLKSKDIIS